MSPGHVWSAAPPAGWNAGLNESTGTKAFLRPAWFAGWSAAFGGEGNWTGSTQYLSVLSGDRLVGALAVASQTVGRLRFASLGGYYQPFRGIVAFDDVPGTTAQMVEGLGELTGFHGVRMGPVPQDDGDLVALVASLRTAGWRVIERRVATGFVLDVPATVEEFDGGLSKKRRAKLRNYWNKMCKVAETELVHHTGGNADDWVRVFDDLGTVEMASWVAESGDPRFAGDRNKIFWTHLAHDAWMREAMHAWVVYHGGTPVSFCFALDAGDTRFVMANSYDARVAEFRTGTKLYHEVIRDAVARGRARVDIGMGDSGYKAQWGAEAGSELIDIVAFPPTLKGRLVHLAARARLAIDARRN